MYERQNVGAVISHTPQRERSLAKMTWEGDECSMRHADSGSHIQVIHFIIESVSGVPQTFELRASPQGSLRSARDMQRFATKLKKQRSESLGVKKTRISPPWRLWSV